jgi:hypothetical protein
MKSVVISALKKILHKLLASVAWDTKFDRVTTWAGAKLLSRCKLRSIFRLRWTLQYRIKHTFHCRLFLPPSALIRNYYQLCWHVYRQNIRLPQRFSSSCGFCSALNIRSCVIVTDGSKRFENFPKFPGHKSNFIAIMNFDGIWRLWGGSLLWRFALWFYGLWYRITW